MTDAPTVEIGTSSEPWFRGRPHSWPFFILGSAMVAVIQWSPWLLFRRPGTPGGWLTWFLVSWAITVTSLLFRNPVLDNPYARRLAARTDPAASGARVGYLLSLVGIFVLGAALLMGAYELLEPYLSSFLSGR
jgi:hypothetical protein